MKDALIEEMLSCAHALAKQGLCASGGVIAAREDESSILISRPGAAFSALSHADILTVTQNDGTLPAGDCAEVCRLLFSRPRLKGALLLQSPFSSALSHSAVQMRASLDDTAQIAGGRIRVSPTTHARAMRRALGRNFGCLLKDNGMLTVGRSVHEAYVAALVLEKGARAEVEGKPFGGAKPLPLLDCLLMRFVYLKKYSKIQEKNV